MSLATRATRLASTFGLLGRTAPIRTIQATRNASTMTSSTFKYLDPASYTKSDEPFVKPWAKVDGPGYSFKLIEKKRSVEDFRGREQDFTVSNSGFQVFNSPAKEKDFKDDATVREGYYAEVEALLKEKLPGVKKVVIFDHTIRRHDKTSARQPVQQVHVDQTPRAAEIRVNRHLPTQEVPELLEKRWQLINVWRPISNPAIDYPLAVIDWRSTSPSDFVKVDLLYPKREGGDDDDRGKEALPDPSSASSTTGYEVKGETYGIVPNEGHKFFYYKDMTPDEAMFIKCFDSQSENLPNGQKGLADCTPHTAFIDPLTPEDAPGRASIEVRCLVFYE